MANHTVPATDVEILVEATADITTRTITVHDPVVDMHLDIHYTNPAPTVDPNLAGASDFAITTNNADLFVKRPMSGVSDFAITTSAADLSEQLPQRVVASTSDSAVLNEGEPLELILPNGIERGDLLLVAVAFRTRAELTTRYIYNLDDEKAGVKVDYVDPDGIPTLAAEGFAFVGLTNIESINNSPTYGGAQIQTFFRRATGQEDSASVIVEIGRHEIEPAFEPVGAVVAAGCLVIRGFQWVGDDVVIGADLDDSFAEDPYTISLTVTPRIIMGVNMTSFRGEVTSTAAASGWTLHWEIDLDGLVFLCFTKVAIGSDSSAVQIAGVDNYESWVSGTAIIEAMGKTVTPIAFTAAPGNLRSGYRIFVGQDPGGERTNEPEPYVWPEPPADDTELGPLVPYAPDEDPETRQGG